MNARRWIALAALSVAALLGVSACSSGSKSGHSHSHGASGPSELSDHQTGKYQGFEESVPLPRPNFTLKDESGADYAFGTRTAGRPTLLFFGYTHCPDDCPTTMADIRLALLEVPADVRSKTLVAFVTTDPKRDSGPVIKKWLAQFAEGLDEAQFIGLTGTQGQIDAAQAAAHVMMSSDNGETHSNTVTLYGPDDYARVSFILSETERQQMVHDLPIIANGT